jgi:hypothetical protein
MRKLKLTLKKEIISDLESKEVKGGKPLDTGNCVTQQAACVTRQNVYSCIGCLPTGDCETKVPVCFTIDDCES